MSEIEVSPTRSIVIGAKVFEARKRLGITQEDLAYRLGVTQGAVGGWERDEFLPALEKIVPLAAQLGVTLDWLISGDVNFLDAGSAAFMQISGLSLIAKLTTALESNALSSAQMSILASLVAEFSN